MSEMPTLIVPNQHDNDWPKERLFISPVIEDFLDLDTKDGLKGILRLNWKAFGKGNTTLPPEEGAVPRVVTQTGDNARLFDGYLQARNRMAVTADSLQEADRTVKEKVKDSDDKRKEAQGKVSQLIIALGDQAGVPPSDGMTEDAHIMEYVDQGMAASEKLMTEAREDQAETGGEIADLTAQVEALTGEVEKWKGLYEDLKNGNGDGDLSTDPTDLDTGDYDITDPGSNDLLTPPALDTGDGTSGTTDGSTGTGSVPSGVQDAVARLGNTGTGAGSTTTPAVDTGSGADSGMGSMMDSMLPMMMMQAMQRNQADSDLNGRSEELDPNRYEHYPGAVAPVTASPAVAQPATAAPATAASTPPSNASSTQPAVAPGRTPDADGSVVYTFPDGRTQKVSAIVAQALDAAFGNASGTDAQTAYEKTTAKWADKKQIGAKVDPYQLMTGDVATWDNRSAVLVVFGSEDGGTLEAIVNGQLVPFASEMSDSTGEFGTFSGFSHPNGIELASGDKGAAPTAPGTGDSSAGAVPLVAAPA
ncbi:hypothetical protein OG563_06185 [Nocardia vinacea]|uniref:Uncharacterized protein n=1 Tax=Nocardia vinacea TaxID=96468 RepID=A0ABZ1YWZ4_9NOCA|nr:hypothetical protein [Nocardia vinacea]